MARLIPSRENFLWSLDDSNSVDNTPEMVTVSVYKKTVKIEEIIMEKRYWTEFRRTALTKHSSNPIDFSLGFRRRYPGNQLRIIIKPVKYNANKKEMKEEGSKSHMNTFLSYELQDWVQEYNGRRKLKELYTEEEEGDILEIRTSYGSLEELACSYMERTKLEERYLRDDESDDKVERRLEKRYYSWIYSQHCMMMSQILDSSLYLTRIEISARTTLEMKRYRKEIQDQRTRIIICKKIDSLPAEMLLIIREWLGAV